MGKFWTIAGRKKWMYNQTCQPRIKKELLLNVQNYELFKKLLERTGAASRLKRCFEL